MSIADRSWDKSPVAKLDYSVDWTDWLASEETISTHDWTVPGGLTEASASESGGICTVWLSGGVVGTVYSVRNEITTSSGREDARTIKITIENR